MDELYLKPMKASDLIAELQRLMAEHGDLPVTMPEDSNVRQVRAYDETGNSRGAAVEFALHGW